MTLLALLLQAASTGASSAPPQRFSILAQSCATARRDGKDVVVCADDPATSDRLPLPGDAPPMPGYTKPDSGDYRDNTGGGSCAATMDGCLVGFGPPIVPMIAAAVNGLRNAAKDRREAAARRRDGDRRVAIPLDGPGSPGHLEP